MSCVRTTALALIAALLAALALMCIDIEPFTLFGIESPEQPASQLALNAGQGGRSLSLLRRHIRASSRALTRMLRSLMHFFAFALSVRIGHALRAATSRMRRQLLVFYINRPQLAPPRSI